MKLMKMMFKYRVPLLFFWILIIITLYMIKSKDWKLNFSSNYQPGLPSSQKSGQDLEPYLVSSTSLPAVNKLKYKRKYGQDIEPHSVSSIRLNIENTLHYVRRYGQVDSIPSKEELANATADQLVSLYHSYLDNIDYLCHRKFRMGKIGDGGWEICDDFEYRPIEPCTIFSFGINYDFSFDDDASALYGCHVYSFDPSMNKTGTHKRSEKVYFYKIGIRGENDFNRNVHLEMMTFSRIRAMLNYSQKIIDVVKMDVEGSEWESLILMAKEGQLHNIRQLLIEYHFGNNMTNYNALIYRLNVLRLVEDHGFRRFYVHKNPFYDMRIGNFPLVRTMFYEIHYVNTLLRRHK